MKFIRDFGNEYRDLGNEQFCLYYETTSETIRKRVYKCWIVPVFMVIVLVAYKLSLISFYYSIGQTLEMLLMLVGVVSTVLVAMDKWYGALLYAVFCIVCLISGAGLINDKILMAAGTITSLMAIRHLLELGNLNTYYDMARSFVKADDLEEME